MAGRADGRPGGAADGGAPEAAVLDSLDRLLRALVLERVGDDRFSVHAEAGQFEDRVFGGQLLAQALVAAGSTVEGQDPQSLHAYFVRAGDPRQPLDLGVHRVRDGRSVSTRRVTISQGDRVLLTVLASFHANPSVPAASAPVSAAAPHDLPLLQHWARAVPPELAPSARSWIERPPPLEIRMAEAPCFLGGTGAEPVRQHWMRLPRTVGDDPMLHAALLAHASDYLLLDMLLRDGKDRTDAGSLSAFSLDHSLWIHRPPRMDRWHCCTQETVTLTGHRGLVRGAIRDEGGSLVATVAQEGLVRPARQA